MYAIFVLPNGRITCATYPKYASDSMKDVYTQEDLIDGYVLVDSLPEGSLTDYLYRDGEYVYDPQQSESVDATQLDRIEAQVAYTAMMTGTLLED